MSDPKAKSKQCQCGMVRMIPPSDNFTVTTMDGIHSTASPCDTIKSRRARIAELEAAHPEVPALEWTADENFENCWHVYDEGLPAATRERYPLWSVTWCGTSWRDDEPVENIKFAVKAHATTIAYRYTATAAKSLASRLASVLREGE